MCSSRLTEDGRCIVTTPGADCPVGTVFYLVGRPGRAYGCDWPDWVRRILMPAQNGNGNGHAWNVGLDTAEAELQLAMQLGLVHPSLVEEPGSPAAAGLPLSSSSG